MAAPTTDPADDLPLTSRHRHAVVQGHHLAPTFRHAFDVARNIKALKDATGCTVNDIVMAICAGALREYLHQARRPARQAVAGDGAGVDPHRRRGDPWTNRVSSIIAELPTNCADPLERVRLCHEAMNAAKRQMDLVPATALTDITQFTSPVVATSAMRLISRPSSPTG